MSDILFISANEKLRQSVAEAMTRAGYQITCCDESSYIDPDESTRTDFDCALVDSRAKSAEIIRFLRWAGVPCVIGVYETDKEHVQQVRAGAMWSIPKSSRCTSEILDGPMSIQAALMLLMAKAQREAEPLHEHRSDRQFEYRRSSPSPGGGLRAVFAALRRPRGKESKTFH